MSRRKAIINWEEKPQDDPREAPTTIKIGETANKKGLQIKRGSDGLWYITFTSGGELPAKLQGKFIFSTDAASAAESYLING